jgi:hypothetical protein
MHESLGRALNEETTFVRRFFVVFGMTLSVMMSILLCLFFFLHLWLMGKATTTIEFCEKAYKRNTGTAASIYNFGVYENIKAVLGPNPLFWLVPIGLPVGDGLTFKHNMAPDTPGKDVVDDRMPGAGSSTTEKLSLAGKSVDEKLQCQTPEVTGHKASVS